jgi:hypothetical protein
MAPLSRVISVVLAVVMTGSAPACAALCAQPVTTAGADSAPADAACRRCAGKAPAPLAPQPQKSAPCKHCETAQQDRVSAERDQPVAPPVDIVVSTASALDVAGLVPSVPRRNTRPFAHPPPRDALYQFCVLLI